MKKNEQLTHLLADTIINMGYELVGVEYHPNSVNALLRVYIDKPEGITLDDCMLVNDQVSGLLDVEDPIPGRYTLEISSPGLDRPLFDIKDFVRFAGKKAKIRLSRPLNNQRNFKGTIDSANPETGEITLTDENDKTHIITFDAVDFARLIPVFDD